VKLWDSEQLSLIADFENDHSIFSSRFHPDGTSLATGAADGKVAVWDIRSKLLL
jgi:WD40 repeat protein